jgi:hypothetical protein
MICETRIEKVVSEATLEIFRCEIEERDKRIMKESKRVVKETCVYVEQYDCGGEEEFIYQQEDFVPLTTSSSPTAVLDIETSFAKVLLNNREPGWQIDLSDDVIDLVKSEKKRGKKKGVLLFGNSSARARS